MEITLTLYEQRILRFLLEMAGVTERELRAEFRWMLKLDFDSALASLAGKGLIASGYQLIWATDKVHRFGKIIPPTHTHTPPRRPKGFRVRSAIFQKQSCRS